MYCVVLHTILSLATKSHSGAAQGSSSPATMHHSLVTKREHTAQPCIVVWPARQTMRRPLVRSPAHHPAPYSIYTLVHPWHSHPGASQPPMRTSCTYSGIRCGFCTFSLVAPFVPLCTALRPVLPCAVPCSAPQQGTPRILQTQPSGHDHVAGWVCHMVPCKHLAVAQSSSSCHGAPPQDT